MPLSPHWGGPDIEDEELYAQALLDAQGSTTSEQQPEQVYPRVPQQPLERSTLQFGDMPPVPLRLQQNLSTRVPATLGGTLSSNAAAPAVNPAIPLLFAARILRQDSLQTPTRDTGTVPPADAAADAADTGVDTGVHPGAKAHRPRQP
ncbi:hypothetical protein NKR23_g8613 [Pleurostoma richardsiae]|uniref:Uncharacterized protein n=1 Tax=Pleurostoma richardsiae TaxID=41990 RepID=A0AA38VFE7_9PEZI|nr:hypothetical protein NKR23_g8613 [Pleurostoma richardsiae]